MKPRVGWHDRRPSPQSPLANWSQPATGSQRTRPNTAAHHPALQAGTMSTKPGRQPYWSAAKVRLSSDKGVDKPLTHVNSGQASHSNRLFLSSQALQIRLGGVQDNRGGLSRDACKLRFNLPPFDFSSIYSVPLPQKIARSLHVANMTSRLQNRDSE